MCSLFYEFLRNLHYIRVVVCINKEFRISGYDVRSDVWSLGITLIELSTGKFPYPKWNNVFDQLTMVTIINTAIMSCSVNESLFKKLILH